MIARARPGGLTNCPSTSIAGARSSAEVWAVFDMFGHMPVAVGCALSSLVALKLLTGAWFAIDPIPLSGLPPAAPVTTIIPTTASSTITTPGARSRTPPQVTWRTAP